MAFSNYPGRSSAVDAVFSFPYAMPSDVIESGATQAISTTLWTPQVGNKFRLIQLYLQLTKSAIQAVSGDILIQIFDGPAANNVILWKGYATVPAAINAGTGDTNVLTARWNAGQLSLVTNNPVVMTLSSALTGGYLNWMTTGLEEIG